MKFHDNTLLGKNDIDTHRHYNTGNPLETKSVRVNAVPRIVLNIEY